MQTAFALQYFKQKHDISAIGPQVFIENIFYIPRGFYL